MRERFNASSLPLNLFRPEANRVRYPSFGARPHAEAEAMTDATVLSILHFGAVRA
jgi:hypothetical protein